jgi:hypothetical protein
MRRSRTAPYLGGVACAALLLGCSFDETGVSSPALLDGAPPIPDAAGQHDAWAGDSGPGTPDAAPLIDAAPLVDADPSCSGSTFECLGDGTARVCDLGNWVDLGDCPLGCDSVARHCRVPSNVPADWMNNGTGAVNIGVMGSPVTINTDTGEIYGESSQVIRPAMTGLHTGSGIWYGQLSQGADDPGLGVFAMQSLTVAAAATLTAEGDRALVILVSDSATISGTLLVNADEQEAGPGGFGGGDPDQAGDGPCAGDVGYGEQIDEGGCTSGSGGGGHGGAGGDGGDSTCGGTWDGGAGGDQSCGNPELIPLAGGSGGAGGTAISDGDDTNPGDGGGGGGAVQITAGDTIAVGSVGGINAGGAGGGQCTGAGGAGGGAGGAVLLEAPDVTLSLTSVVAANGGGGGGGDCT